MEVAADEFCLRSPCGDVDEVNLLVASVLTGVVAVAGDASRYDFYTGAGDFKFRLEAEPTHECDVIKHTVFPFSPYSR